MSTARNPFGRAQKTGDDDDERTTTYDSTNGASGGIRYRSKYYSSEDDILRGGRPDVQRLAEAHKDLAYDYHNNAQPIQCVSHKPQWCFFEAEKKRAITELLDVHANARQLVSRVVYRKDDKIH
ncbi:unnamed protein product [Schistocephalus solidus]|uniref:Uncharacterized protein n=1 Tax=Schistocephalus solidus TaxID=70667 RepID=A0A183T6H4_SCHSO|nr:unnamed protein product [Schistocephalus solidus]